MYKGFVVKAAEHDLWQLIYMAELVNFSDVS